MQNLSFVGNNIVGSEIIKISQQIKEVSKTRPVQNFSIGDFNPKINPIPEKLKEYIVESYNDGLTNYPMSPGELDLRVSVSNYIKKTKGIEYTEEEILIGCGVRPLIYTIFKTIVDSEDTVMYPVPSWNNNHYSFLHSAIKIPIECNPDNSFFPTFEDVKGKLENTRLLCLCSPQNPTGRVIDKDTLKQICDEIVRINKEKTKKTYLFFDQIYSDLVPNGLFTHPLDVCPEIRDYLICVDGISKSLCATGVRVGWVFGPKNIISKMTEIFSHIGAWSPKPEQTAVAKYLNDYELISEFITNKVNQYSEISNKICEKLEELKQRKFRIDYQKPEGGIYISIYLGESQFFTTVENYVQFLIKNCGVGLVPFEYFGSTDNNGWFRMSIGGVDINNIDEVTKSLETICVKSISEVNSWLV
jgi:aspartate aminotransferase